MYSCTYMSVRRWENATVFEKRFLSMISFRPPDFRPELWPAFFSVQTRAPLQLTELEALSETTAALSWKAIRPVGEEWSGETQQQKEKANKQQKGMKQNEHWCKSEWHVHVLHGHHLVHVWFVWCTFHDFYECLKKKIKKMWLKKDYPWILCKKAVIWNPVL